MTQDDHVREVRVALDEAGEAHAPATRALTRAEEAAAAAGVSPAAVADVITVQRINIVEPDGTLRLVVTNAAQFPGLIVRGQEHEHPGRAPAAGMLFFNDEATETGGLMYAGAATPGGHTSGVHLSYDNFEQDQVIVLSASDDGPEERFAQLEFVDRPDWSLVDVITGGEGPEADGERAERHSVAESGQAARRMRLARETDGSVGLSLRDAQGRPRITLCVDAKAEAGIRILKPRGPHHRRDAGRRKLARPCSHSR